MKIANDIFERGVHAALRAIRSRPWLAPDRTLLFKSCSAEHFCCNFNAGISKPPRCSPGHSSCGPNWIPSAPSPLPRPREPFLNRGNGIGSDLVRTARAVEDDETRGPCEPIVVCGDFSQEGKVFEPNEIGSAFDALPPQLGGHPQEEGHIGTQDPRFARSLQEPDRIAHGTFESRALICVRRIRIPIAQDELPPLKMGTDFGHMRSAIGKEQKRFRDGADIAIVRVAHRIAEPGLRGLARQMDAVPFRPERFRDEATHRRLPRTIDALKSYETGEHAPRQRTYGSLNRRCPVRVATPHNVFIESGGSVARRAMPRGAGTISWKIHPDMRRLSDGGDREARCRKCHVRIVVLPDDRRQGFCFDCYDSLEIHSKIAV